MTHLVIVGSRDTRQPKNLMVFITKGIPFSLILGGLRSRLPPYSGFKFVAFEYRCEEQHKFSIFPSYLINLQTGQHYRSHTNKFIMT